MNKKRVFLSADDKFGPIAETVRSHKSRKFWFRDNGSKNENENKLFQILTFYVPVGTNHGRSSSSAVR